MLYCIVSRLKFFIRSTNQHGVHSPFVYDFVTKGLYVKHQKKNDFKRFEHLEKLSKKEKKILFKIIRYFDINDIYKELSKSLDNNYKILFINDIVKINIDKSIVKNKNQFILIKGIYNNKKSTALWKKVIQKKDATVTIDLFYFGVIFFRNEQEKEHFIIRV